MLRLDQRIVIVPCLWETYEALLDQDDERCKLLRSKLEEHSLNAS